MKEELVRANIGKKVLIILRNNFQFTSIIPKFVGDSFTILDKFGKTINICCDFIASIQEV